MEKKNGATKDDAKQKSVAKIYPIAIMKMH